MLFLQLNVLSIRLPRWQFPYVIVTLKNRTLSPMAQVFIERVREVAKPLAGPDMCTSIIEIARAEGILAPSRNETNSSRDRSPRYSERPEMLPGVCTASAPAGQNRVSIRAPGIISVGGKEAPQSLTKIEAARIRWRARCSSSSPACLTARWRPS